jgi:enoyl-CoA hydratase
MTVEFEQCGKVVIVTLNRPEALNALNREMMALLVERLPVFDRDPGVGCFIITGSDNVFAAGADIKEMIDRSYMDMFHEDFLAGWQTLANLRTPTIAAVSGYALGGGCELAMMCDILYAADTAVFAQPEVKLGLMPGMGGSQRLIRVVGKARAMEMILTGRPIDATEAAKAGLVARVFPREALLEEAIVAAELIAGYGKAAVMAAREAVIQSMDMSLSAGLQFERRLYHSLWASNDAQEGMAAFVAKRRPEFSGR